MVKGDREHTEYDTTNTPAEECMATVLPSEARNNRTSATNILSSKTNNGVPTTTTTTTTTKTPLLESNGERKGGEKWRKKTRRSKKIQNTLKNMVIYYCNIRGMKSKINSLGEIIEDKRPTIIVLVETWMHPKQKVKIEGYDIYRNDRDNTGGGILVAVDERIKNVTREVSRTTGDMESIWLTINNNTNKIRVGAVYIPKENIDKKKLKEGYKKIQKEWLEGKKNGEKILTIGDFNCKVGDEIPGNKEEVSKGGIMLKEARSTYDMTIVNGTPKCTGIWTRVEGTTKSILDYVLVSEKWVEVGGSGWKTYSKWK